jgi:hypothetical protein
MNKKTEEKYLYSFEAKDDSGKSRKFGILKPTRKMKEDGELFYASKLSQFISAGILPKIVWEKVFKDSGGIISGVDQKEYADLFSEYSEYRNQIDEVSTKSDAQKTEADKEKLAFCEAQLVRVRKRMQELEMAQVNAFENTAEAKARNRTIVWWAANLGVEENVSTGEILSLLGGGSIDDKLDLYDSIVENDKFLSECFSRLNYLVTVWYLGSASSFEDFKQLDEEYFKRIKQENDDSQDSEINHPLEDKKEEEKNQEEPVLFEAKVSEDNKEAPEILKVS